jgi:hypothetical protein
MAISGGSLCNLSNSAQEILGMSTASAFTHIHLVCGRYIPRGQDFQSFVKVMNVFDHGMVTMTTEKASSANQWSWKTVHAGRQPIQGFPLPYDISG